MKVFLSSVAFLVALSLVLCYDEKFDKIDADKIIADDALFTAYSDCMLDRAPCTVEHSEDLKQLLPEVIATACEKCTPIQKTNVRKTVKALAEKKPEDFTELRKKYDPEGKHEATFTAFILGE